MAHTAKMSEASRRPARIVPVIPLPYTRGVQPKRAASPKQLQRALTPDPSDKSGRPLAHNGTRDNGYGAHPTSTVQEPMTPESLPSSTVKEKISKVSPAASLNGGGTGGDEQHAKFGAVNSHGEI
jgi:hypothetical protein